MLNTIIILAIRGYKLLISPMLGARCRFYPTCSQYCIECFQRFSFFKALWYSTFRVIRCNPLCEGGIDHVHIISSKENGV